MSNIQVPASWIKCELDDLILRMSNGANVKQFDEKVGLPISRIETIWNQLIDQNRVKYIKDCSDDFVTKYLIENSDILFSHINSDSHLGKTAIYKGSPPNLIHGVNLLLIRFSPEVSRRFMNYQFNFLRAKGAFIEVAQRAVNQSSINQKTLKRTPFVLPPINEQKRIVDKIEELFTELDKGVESLKKAREQLKVYRQALLKQAFEGKLTEQWRKDNPDKLESPEQLLERIEQEREVSYQQKIESWKAAVEQWEFDGKEGKKPRKPFSFKALPQISTNELDILPLIPGSWAFLRLAEIAHIGSGMSVSNNRKLENPVKVPYLRVANVQRGCLVLDEIKTMPIEAAKLNDLLLQKWDILFNEGGDRDKLGRGWVWESQVKQCITQNHVFRATTYLGGEKHSKFISHWGNTYGQDYFETGGKQTTNLASINKTVLSMFPVPMPPLEEQRQIINILDEKMSNLDSYENDVEATIQMSEALRHSILQKAFSGKLVPQEPEEEPASVLLERIVKEKEKNKTTKKVSKKKTMRKAS